MTSTHEALWREWLDLVDPILGAEGLLLYWWYWAFYEGWFASR